jgi:hypothetical protein
MKHQDGRCAVEAETIYVEQTMSCAATATAGGGTAGMPYCSMNPALAAVDRTHDLLLVRGFVYSAQSPITGGTSELSIIGGGNATLEGGTIPAAHIGGGDVYLRGLKLSGGNSYTVQADAGSLVKLDHVEVAANSGAGILLDGASFDIENTLVSNNGFGFLGVVSWGGIFVNNPPAAGPAKLRYVTVQYNKSVGITCSAPLTMTEGVLASANVISDIMDICGFSSCGFASATCGVQP